MDVALVADAGKLPRTKQRFVYQVLREAIMRCELAPGQRLIAETVARQLSVSPIPVREALQLLQSEGLVESIPHVGAIVAPISADAVVETFTVMEGLEIVATRTAAERLTEANVQALTAALTEMDATLQAGAHQQWGDLNSQFHQSIAAITGMPLLREMTARAFGQWDRVRRYFFHSVLYHRIGRSQQEHYAILRAMQGRDYVELERLVKVHNQEAMAAYIEYMATNPLPRGSSNSGE